MNQSDQSVTIVKVVLTVLLIFIITVLQTTIVQGFEIFHVVPNLLFIMVVCYGILHGDYGALVVGVVCGLLLDITGARVVGMNTLLCTLAAYFCICISDSLFNNNVLVAMVFVLLLSIPYELIIYIFNFVIWGRGSFWYALFYRILPGGVYNFLVTILLYPIIRRVTLFRQ
ncbi:MAG: rod shape-determining protein MreD [Clostridia bacterium]|nr:rod shape-determining protein MreD [Clostridia bacterium]